MECPNCKHATSNTALLQCSQCGEAFERGALEEFQHLDYLADWLAERPEITPKLKGQLLGLVEKKQDTLLGQLLPKVPVEEVKPAETVEAKPAPVVEVKPAQEKPTPVAVKSEAK